MATGVKCLSNSPLESYSLNIIKYELWLLALQLLAVTYPFKEML